MEIALKQSFKSIDGDSKLIIDPSEGFLGLDE